MAGAAVAAAVACTSLLAVLPFTGFDAYVHALRLASSAYDQDSYTVFGLASRQEAPKPLLVS